MTLAVAISGYSLSILGGDMGTPKLSADQQAGARLRLKALTSLSLPETATVLGFEEGGAIDGFIRLKALMTEAELDRVLSSGPISRSTLTADRRGVLQEAEGWWDVDQAQGIVAEQVYLAESNSVLNLGIAKASEATESFLLYVLWYSI